MSAAFHVVAKADNLLGECVLWDGPQGLVRWLDILGKTISTLDPRSGAVQTRPMPRRPGCMALTKAGDALLVGFEDGLARLEIESGAITPLCRVEESKPYTRVNDGRCDRHGNFIFGTIDEAEVRPRGAWYRYTAEGALQALSLPPVAIPNSVCFSLDGGRLFFSDGVSPSIQCCDYDPANGRIENLRVFAPVTDGYPDGSTVDAEGFIWNAVWGASRLVRYRPDGQIDRVIPTPVTQPTCAVFGGPALDTLYLTSARIGLGDDILSKTPDAGALFALPLTDVRGVPESRWGR